MTDPTDRRTAFVALLCLFGAGCGAAASAHDASSPRPSIVAAMGPQEAQAWVTVVVDAFNKLFTLVNVAIGVWQGATVLHHHHKRRQRRRQASPGKAGRGPGHDAAPHREGESGPARSFPDAPAPSPSGS